MECGSLLPLWVQWTAYITARRKAAASCRTPRHTIPPPFTYNTAAQILAEGGHSGRLQIQISENVPPEVWRKSFPQIVKAIRDFGPIRACR
jgi:hypothetical protein